MKSLVLSFLVISVSLNSFGNAYYFSSTCSAVFHEARQPAYPKNSDRMKRDVLDLFPELGSNTTNSPKIKKWIELDEKQVPEAKRSEISNRLRPYLDSKKNPFESKSYFTIEGKEKITRFLEATQKKQFHYDYHARNKNESAKSLEMDLIILAPLTLFASLIFKGMYASAELNGLPPNWEASLFYISLVFFVAGKKPAYRIYNYLSGKVDDNTGRFFDLIKKVKSEEDSFVYLGKTMNLDKKSLELMEENAIQDAIDSRFGNSIAKQDSSYLSFVFAGEKSNLSMDLFYSKEEGKEPILFVGTKLAN